MLFNFINDKEKRMLVMKHLLHITAVMESDLRSTAFAILFRFSPLNHVAPDKTSFNHLEQWSNLVFQW